jgi:hypothetical protein
VRPVPSTILVLALSIVTTGCAEESLWPVRATMDDSQVLMGEIATPELLLEGGLGTLAIPWEDVGEVVPVEGDELGGSGGYVDVWLRNGSELTGRWVDAELTMELSVGGDDLAVDVPVSKLLRLQTQGGEVWPQGVVYRVRSSHGDDFLVDPEASRLVLENEMGTFAPFLSECISATPLEDPEGDWRIELTSGTVLVGPLADDAVTFQLAMGPSEATVPLDKLVSLERQDWGGYLYQDESSSISDRLMSALPGPAKRQLQPVAAAPVEAWDANTAEPMDHIEELGAMAGERIPDGSEGLEVDGRFHDTGLSGSGSTLNRGGQAVGSNVDALGGQRSAEGWFSNTRLREVKHAMH